MDHNTRSIGYKGRDGGSVDVPVQEPETLSELLGVEIEEVGGFAGEHCGDGKDVTSVFLSGFFVKWQNTARDRLKELDEAGASDEEIVEVLAEHFEDYVYESRRAAQGKTDVPSEAELRNLQEEDPEKLDQLRERLAKLG